MFSSSPVKGTSSKFRRKKAISRGSIAGVYLAERADGQYDKVVALKIMKPSCRSGRLHKNFKSEKHILASFNHPNIARFYEGGVTSDGFPYIVIIY